MKVLARIFVLLVIGAQGISAQDIEVTKVLNGFGAIEKGSVDGIKMKQGFIIKRMVNDQLVVMGRASVVAVHDQTSAIRPDQDDFSLQVGDLLFPPEQASVPKPPQPVPPPPQSAPPSKSVPPTPRVGRNTEEDVQKDEAEAQTSMHIGANQAPFRIGGGFSLITANDQAEGGVGFNALFDFWPSNSILVKAGLGGFSSDVKYNTDLFGFGDRMSGGPYSLFWVESSLLLAANNPNIQPYGGAGVGYYSFRHELNDNSKNFLALQGYSGEESLKGTIGFHLRGGINIPISSALHVNADAKFIFARPKLESTSTYLLTGQTFNNDKSQGLNTLVFTVGLMGSL